MTLASTTKVKLRQALSELMGDYRAFTTTADGSSAKNTLVSDTLKNYQGGSDPGGLEGWHFLATSGVNAGETREASNYAPTASAGATVIVQSTYTNATASGETFELHRVDPELKTQAIDRAIIELFPVLYLPVRDESIIVDSLLLNGDFEDVTSGIPDNWTESGTGTTSVDTSTVFHGTNSMKLVAGAGGVYQRYQDLSLASITEVEGLTAKFKMRVWASAASSGRIIIDDGVTTANSDYHGGGSEWQLIDVSAAVGASATRVRVTCEAAASATVYFDLGWSVINPLYRYTVPTSIIRGPLRILQQYDESRPDGPYYPLLEGSKPTEGRLLRLEGMGLLTRPSTESATTEVGEPQVRLIAAYAAMVLNQTLLSRAAMNQQARLEAEVQRWQREVARLSGQAGIRMKSMPTDRFANTWYIGEDSTSRYIDALGARSGLSFTTA
jgi:hypothetical protein